MGVFGGCGVCLWVFTVSGLAEQAVLRGIRGKVCLVVSSWYDLWSCCLLAL